MGRPRGTYKQPSGVLEIEGVTTVAHTFRDGEDRGRQDGLTWHTGRYRFRYEEDGKRTRWYTPGQAPKWLQVMIRQVREVGR